LTSIIVLQSAPAPGASIGASFAGDGDGIATWQLAPTDSAGVVPQTHWNNISTTPTGNVGISDPLFDSAGNLTAIQLQFDANDAWNANGATDTPDQKLMKGVIKEGSGGSGTGTTMFLTFTNFALGTYDLYVYGDVNDDGSGFGLVDMQVSVGGVTKYWEELTSFEAFGDTFVEVTSTDPLTYMQGNYAKFAGVTPVQGAISVSVTLDSTLLCDGLGIAGLQLVASGSFPSNTMPVGIAVQPQEQLATPGQTAGFSVVASGPVTGYQWFKNGSVISGATDSTYTTPAVTLADNGAKYKVTVHNNVNSVTSDEVALTVMNDPGTRVASIGVNFRGSDGSPANVLQWQLAPTDSAGVVPQANWNNLNFGDGNWGNIGAPPGGFVGIADFLLDSGGRSTTASLRVNCNDSWNADGPTDTPNDKVMKGVIKQAGDGSSMTLTFTNLTAESAFLDLYVYGNVDTGPEDVDLTVGTTTYYWTQPGAFDDATGFIQSASLDPDARAEGNYVKFTGVGVTPSSAITITATVQGGPTGLGIAGVQVFSSAPFPTNTLAPVVTQQPVSTYAVVGGTASFTIGLNGPWAVQWRRNGTPISGATDLTYTTPPLALSDSGASYDASITNNVGSTNSAAATVTVDSPTPAVLTQGFLTVQRYTDIDGEYISALYGDPNFPASPTTVYWVPGADLPQTVPNLENFGAIAWGWLAPAVTSDYTFFIRSDDHSAFYINTSAAAPGVTNAVPIPNSGAPGSDLPVCEEGGCCTDFLEPDPNQPDWHSGELAGLGQTTLTPIPLEAGRLYGICLVYKEGGGDDYVQLAWRPGEDSTPAANLQPIPMLNVWTMASHAGNRVSITQHPQSTTVLVGATATFTVDASTLPVPDQWAAQWLKDGLEIPGANDSSSTTPPLTLADTGAAYTARIIALAGVTNSAPATVTVVTNLGITLTIQYSANTVTIGWDSTSGTLESAPALLGDDTVWTTVGTQNPVTLPVVAGENRFYRVKQ